MSEIYDILISDFFLIYRINMHERVNRTETQFRSLPASQQKLLPQFLPHLGKIRQCIDHNQGILKIIVNDCSHMFENKEYDDAVCLYCTFKVIFICFFSFSLFVFHVYSFFPCYMFL